MQASPRTTCRSACNMAMVCSRFRKTGSTSPDSRERLEEEPSPHRRSRVQARVQFDLGLAAKGIRVLYPQGMREGIDGNVRLTGSTDSALLGGSISLSDISFTSAFDLTNFISQFSGGVTPATQSGFQPKSSIEPRCAFEQRGQPGKPARSASTARQTCRCEGLPQSRSFSAGESQ